MTGSEVQRWADKAMFKAEDMPADAQQKPKVHLIWMTPDPLGAAAAMNNIYEGRVSRSLADVTHAEREQVLEDMQKTVLKLPMENINFHFLIEGVTRALTHQLVRQRHAGFAQESMRFAVFGQDGAPLPVALPPSLHGTMSAEDWWEKQGALAPMDNEQTARMAWDRMVQITEDTYGHLIELGMPAEDARGILPTNILTRIHWIVNLRSLHQFAGLRLSTQAQFEWREVFAGIINAIRTYHPYPHLRRQLRNVLEADDAERASEAIDYVAASDAWQYEGIANLFRPVCYYTGKCEFMGTADRYCSIRDRVQANHAIGRPSSEWHEGHVVNPLAFYTTESMTQTGVGYGSDGKPVAIAPIHPGEWLTDPKAARRA